MSSDELSRTNPATTEQVYHVVCRDCPMEELVDSRAIAKRLEAVHRGRTDHTVVQDRIQ